MKQNPLLVLASLLLTAVTASAQTKLDLSSIVPGSERVQLVVNGDFQSTGAADGTNGYPNPTGWTRIGDMSAGPGKNTVQIDEGVVAVAHTGNKTDVSGYNRSVSLQPNTEYVLSCYMWNMGDMDNNVIAVIDMSDVPEEPQMTLTQDDQNGDKGYFCYSSFNTKDTGTNITLRIFYESPSGKGAAANYFPIAAQWDNIAITKASEFEPPQPSGMTANLRPIVRITNPGEGESLSNAAAGLHITATASDFDGSVTNVAFFDGSTRLGAKPVAPYTLDWTKSTPGSHTLTAVAADNKGALTVSAPVKISIAGAKETKTAVVDPSTLEKKKLMGYQGWFACPGDGSPTNQWKWRHWFHGPAPTADNVSVDLWPDLSEFDADELYPTAMKMADGSPATLYAAWNAKSVARHFKWMQDNHLDGVMLQRFTAELRSPALRTWRNQVAENVRAGAEQYGRVFAIMYDISGQSPRSLVRTLTNDWAYLTSTDIVSSPRYLHHHGKPVVVIWGFGFTDRPGTARQAKEVIDYFKAAGCTVVGGVPTNWRTLDGDSQTDPAWAATYRSFDVISPWSVGRYANNDGADEYQKNIIIPDLADTKAHGIGYLPVIFPGFSWHNLHKGPLNQIPRNGGDFYWHQVYNAVSAGCTMLYGAMFDEVDEGTAMYKVAATPAQLPQQARFVPLNIDGQNLPNDWYLRLADAAGQMLRGEIPLQTKIPITP